MMIASNDVVLGPDDVPEEIRERTIGEASPEEAAATTLRVLRARAERQIVVDALRANDWHISRTARQLGLADHSSLLKIMRRHNLRKPPEA